MSAIGILGPLSAKEAECMLGSYLCDNGVVGGIHPLVARLPVLAESLTSVVERWPPVAARGAPALRQRLRQPGRAVVRAVRALALRDHASTNK